MEARSEQTLCPHFPFHFSSQPEPPQLTRWWRLLPHAAAPLHALGPAARLALMRRSACQGHRAPSAGGLDSSPRGRRLMRLMRALQPQGAALGHACRRLGSPPRAACHATAWWPPCGPRACQARPPLMRLDAGAAAPRLRVGPRVPPARSRPPPDAGAARGSQPATLTRRPGVRLPWRPVGPLAGVPCDLVARHAVEGLHWMPLSATTRGGSRCHALLRRLVVSDR